MSFLEFVPDLERLRLSHLNVETSRQVNTLMSSKKLRGFVAEVCQVDCQMLRKMLAGHRLVEFRYKPAIENLTADEGYKFAEYHVVDCLMGSQQSLQKVSFCPTRPSKSPHLSQFDNFEFLEMQYQHEFVEATIEHNPQGIAEILRERIPGALSILTLRYVQPSDNVSLTMEVLADLKHQGEFPKLKTVRLNFCRFSRSSWFPPVPYDSIGQMAVETLGEILEKAGLHLELAQTD